MSALPSSSKHAYGTRGKDDPWASQPTLEVYPALGSVFNSLRPALARTTPLPTDPAVRLRLAQLIVNENDKLCAAAGDSRVAANDDFLSFWRALSHLLHELHPATYDTYRWKWDWLTNVPYTQPFFGFQDDSSSGIPPVTVPPPPPPPPPPKMTAPPQAPPVAGPSTQTRPPPVVPPRAVPNTRPPQDPSQMEGLYRLPTPVSADSDLHPFGVVPGWNPQLPTYLVENWSREVASQVTKPPHGAVGKVEKTADPQPPSESEEEVPRPRKPIVKKKFSKKEKPSRPLYWLHQDEQPLPPHLPGQETSVDDHGRQLPCPNSFREYLLPDEQWSFLVSARPKSVLAPSHLLPPFGLKPRSDIKRKQKSDSHPKVKPPQRLPVYGKGPLFQQGHLLAELQAPLLEGYAPPDWLLDLTNRLPVTGGPVSQAELEKCTSAFKVLVSDGCQIIENTPTFRDKPKVVNVMIAQDNHLGLLHNYVRRHNLNNKFPRPLRDTLQNLIVDGIAACSGHRLNPWTAQRDVIRDSGSSIPAKRPASTWSPAIGQSSRFSHATSEGIDPSDTHMAVPYTHTIHTSPHCLNPMFNSLAPGAAGNENPLYYTAAAGLVFRNAHYDEGN
ncbi:hypothetical protein EST38_g5527 [Candolleomyces aberdarensis]|uniref:Uncharacterized protein n=1 Tax=Candolleomyces aberdarensis TaxID=2316362 RepID=A0A4Q2DK97_9AGAR|nr:hypothetical protein EST38_g5527 [Candolleomyces aberdarensis]